LDPQGAVEVQSARSSNLAIHSCRSGMYAPHCSYYVKVCWFDARAAMAVHSTGMLKQQHALPCQSEMQAACGHIARINDAKCILYAFEAGPCEQGLAREGRGLAVSMNSKPCKHMT
jgi:hypothetical protein